MQCLLSLSLLLYPATAYTDNDHALDIDDYQFHFSTFEYTFNIESLSAIIQHPFDDNLNITLDIDFNKTISLSIDNITLDFFNINDFTEITYTSSIQNKASYHRHLLSQEANPKIIKGNYNDLYKVFEKQAQDAVKKQTGNAKSHLTNGMPADLHSLNDLVSREIHEEILENDQEDWRNRMFDESMGNGHHPGFPTRSELDKYKMYNKHPPPRGYDPHYDEYRQMRTNALYNTLRKVPLHDAESLKKRYSPPDIQEKEEREYPEPPQTPRTMPYHHGKYIGIPERKSWFMAQQFCREQYGTNLASVMNDEELGEIRHVCDEVASYGHCWIGLRRPFGTWMDGWPVVIDNWGENGANNLHELPLNCVEILHQDQVWNAQLCTVARSFICETPRKRTRGKYIAVGQTLSWASAENYCQQTYNTNLARINTERENRLAMNLCRDINSEMHHCWIGLYAPFNVWTDRKQAVYTNFNKFREEESGHKGIGVYVNKKEEPEPYGEDEESNYPAAAMAVFGGDDLRRNGAINRGDDVRINGAINQGDDLRMNGAINHDVDKLMTNVQRHANAPVDEMEKTDENNGRKQRVAIDRFSRIQEMAQRMRMERRAKEIEKEDEDEEDEGKTGTKTEEESDPNKCVLINTSYGGVWDKTRCSFRHFFMCNNPGYKVGATATEEEHEEEREYSEQERKFNPNKIKRKKKRKKRRKNREQMMYEREREREGNEDYMYRRRLKFKMKKMKGKHGKMLGAIGGKLLGRMMRGGVGGGGSADTRDRRHKRDAWRRSHEGKSRWKRRESRRRKRKRRRRRFRRWLHKHYGNGVARECGRRCPHRHIAIRTLPKHLDWNPLNGLMPMFGVQGYHGKKHKKAATIHIVAKVHLPKHRAIEGDLDYTLLSALLFDDTDLMKKALKNTFKNKENKVSKMVKGDEKNGLVKDGRIQDEEEHKGERQYNKWDKENDDRFGGAERRRLVGCAHDGVHTVSHCVISAHKYSICVYYDVCSLLLRVSVSGLEYKVRRMNVRRAYRGIVDLNGDHYADYDVLQENESNNDNDDEYGLFEAISGNLGFALFEYESMDWHSVKESGANESKSKYKYKYGDYDNFAHYIRFNEAFSFMISSFSDKECSVAFDGLPFKLCLNESENGMIAYFEKDDATDVLDPIFSFRMKHFIDEELQEAMFRFNHDKDWDQINVINMNAFIQKCSYLHIAKLCLKRNNENGSIVASISFQFLNKKKSN